MRIPCPYCGERGTRASSPISATRLSIAPIRAAATPRRPPSRAGSTTSTCATTPPAPHRELWYHGHGCRAWLVVTRDTRTHAILGSSRARGDRRTRPRRREAKHGRASRSRLAAGGLIDRTQPLPFTLRRAGLCRAFAGDTLASALLANGVQLVGRSFKYHRPRGILHRRLGGAERARRVAHRRAARAEHARHRRRALRRAGRREPEPLAVAALRRDAR